MYNISFSMFVHFLCLPKENEPKEKAPFARWFASDYEIFALHAIFRKKNAKRNSKQNFITTVQKDCYDKGIIIKYIFMLSTLNDIKL